MNYIKIYNSIVNKRKNYPAHGYVERHHIVPVCIGGSNEKSNTVKLSPREHFICHLLLAKIYGGKLCAALFFMCHKNSNSAKGVIVTSRTYDAARRMFVDLMKKNKGKLNPNYGKEHSESSRDKISKSRLKYKKQNHPRSINKKVKWVNKDGRVFYGSHFDLAEFAGISSDSLRKVVNGNFYSYFGWTCPSSGRINKREGENNNTADKNVYKWISPEGDVVFGTRSMMVRDYDLHQSGTSNLVRGVVKKHKGWSIVG